MKIPYFFGAVIMLILANAPESYSSYHNIYLVRQIKPNPMAKSKPAYTKYAAVSFLKSDTGIDFARGQLDVKSQCGALGYVIPVSRCSGEKIKPSKLCSSEVNMDGADGFTTGCCDSRIYTVTENEVCPNNAAKLVTDKCYYNGQNYYRCACDRGRYQYSTIPGEGCGYNGAATDFTKFNVNLMCAAYEPSLKGQAYYFISCCPDSYSQCNYPNDNHEVGRGNECRTIKDPAQGITSGNIISKFEECVCASHYDTICEEGKLIDVNNVCRKNGLIYTTESNCESNCTKKTETNVDDYLFRRIWHCLYEPEGATIRSTEGALCGKEKVDDATPALPKYYESCATQGFTKSIADCYNADVMLRCPNDSTKVWCLEGKYCTGFDVGSYGDVSYCTEGADIDYCPASDKGTRCQYKNSICHCMWNDGNLDTSLTECRKHLTNAEAMTLFNSPTIDGNDMTCCKRGYKMTYGKCLPNLCNRDLYPYQQRPGEQMGTEEICYQGDTTASLGYRAFYGYASCNGNVANGEKWIQKGGEGAESRQCICARHKELDGTPLPFSAELFFDTNSDATDDYAYIGFNQGGYGEQVDCTDAEGSYYGYKSCFIGSRMLKVSDEATGKCLKQNQNGSYNYSFPYYNSTAQARAIASLILESAGLSSVNQATRPITNNLGDASKVYCINPTQHCPNGDAEQCDESVKSLLMPGCVKGWEEECGYKCYHKNILVPKGGIYKLNTDGVKMMVNTFDNTTIQFGFETCPVKKGYIKSTGVYSSGKYYNTCFRFCSMSNKSACQISDVLTTYTEAELETSKFTASSIDKDKVVGVVYAKDGVSGISCGTTGKLHVVSIKYKNSVNFENAQKYLNEEFRTALNNDTIYGLGSWHLPTTTEFGSGCLTQMVNYITAGTTTSLGGGKIEESWTATSGVYRNCCGTANTSATSTRPVHVVIDIPY